MKELILTQLLPPIMDMAVVALLAFAASILQRLTGIQLDAKHRDALQGALENGARLLLLPGGTVDDAIAYVSRAVPDALKHFGRSTPDEIRQLLEPRILALPKLPDAKPASDQPALKSWFQGGFTSVPDEPAMPGATTVIVNAPPPVDDPPRRYKR